MPRATKSVVRGAAAYQASSLLSACLGVVTFAAYTQALGERALGTADLILSWLVLLGILGRLGLGEALLRHWYLAEEAQRMRLQRSVQGLVALSSSLLCVAVVLLSVPIADALPGASDPWVVRIAAAGLFAYCNLEIAQTLLRVRDDRGAYLVASMLNVVLTIALSLVLVVGFDAGLRGYLIGNYASSALVLAALWSRELGMMRRRPVLRRSGFSYASRERAALEESSQVGLAAAGGRRALLRFGLPTVPAELSIFSVNILDRTLLAALAAPTAVSALGAFTYASKIASGVILMARGFQLAFPPMAYRLRDPSQAKEFYAVALRWYVLILGATVAGVTLAAPWVVAALVRYPAGDADPRPAVVAVIPWLAIAWAIWGVIPVMTSIAGRIGAPGLATPAALVGLLLNAVALVLLVPPYGAQGAAAALVVAYVGLIAGLHVATRRHFSVRFDWLRMGLALGSCGLVVLSALWLPAEGWWSAAARAVAFAVLMSILWRFGLNDAERTRVARAAAVRPGSPLDGGDGP